MRGEQQPADVCLTELEYLLFGPQAEAAMFEARCGAFYRIWTPWKTDLLAVMFVFTLTVHCAKASLGGKYSHG